MKDQEKEIEYLYEQMRVGMALFETARLNDDKNVALPLAKQGLSLIAGASKAFLDNPDLCPPYRKIPIKWPPKKRWWEIVIDNPLLDPDYGLRNAEVLGILENLRGSITAPAVQEAVKNVAELTLQSVRV